MTANRSAAAVEVLESSCEYRDEHPAIARDLSHLRDEIDRVDRERKGNETKLFERLDALGQRISNLEGRLVGYLVAASILTAGLVFVAERVFKGG